MVMRGIVKLNCRLCPSCIWAPAYPSGCIRPCLGDSSNSWQRTLPAPAAPAVPIAAPELDVSENPPLSTPALPAQTGVAETDSEKERKSRITIQVDGDDKEDKDEKEEGDAGRDDDRSRSPRLRRHHESFDPNEAADLLSSTTGLAVGITSMVAALKGSTDKLEILIKSTHTLQSDLCRSLEAVGEAVTNMARASESLAAGVNHNTSRVGAMVGELTKLKKHVEWSLDASMKDTLRDNKKGAWKGISRYKTSCLNSRRAWINSRRTSS